MIHLGVVYVRAKTAEESLTVQTQIVLYGHANGAGRLFGGQLMSWVDIAGAVAARRHSGCEVVTAAIDSMSFDAAARPNDIVIMTARLTHAGRTSMEVCVQACVEVLGGMKRTIGTSHIVYVAVDWEGKPTQVPPLIPGNEEERLEQTAAAARRESRMKNRAPK